jgi:hypothetical protein
MTLHPRAISPQHQGLLAAFALTPLEVSAVQPSHGHEKSDELSFHRVESLPCAMAGESFTE